MAEKLWALMEKSLIENGKAFISVSGGGGKTSFLVEFSSFLKSRGYSVLITTSTKVASPYSLDYKVDRIYLDSSIKYYWPRKGESVFFGSIKREDGKITSPSEGFLSLLSLRYDVVIVEADGSRRLPLKLHTSRDPVIWGRTTAIVAIAGMWGYGRRVEDVVFGDHGEGVVDKKYLEYLISSPEGLLKAMDGERRNVVLFNGGDSVGEEVMSIFSSLSLPQYTSAFLVSIKEGKVYGSL